MKICVNAAEQQSRWYKEFEMKRTNVTPLEFWRLVKKMMKGHKFDMFILHLSFIGWIFLSIFTFGIGLLWLLPYMMTAQAAFYQDVKKEYNK